ncbi:MAG: T9SS type A sorting domain-containing protein [Bacteroidales bacterium]
MVRTKDGLHFALYLAFFAVTTGWLFPFTALGQFAPPAGQPETTAIHKDSTIFKGWATGCEVVRGPINISRQELGPAAAGSCEDVIGKAGAKGTLSLGDGGHVTLTFDPPITNGPGWDFAVFENAFDDYFLELGFVEVSSDGEHFVRFPNTSLTPTTDQVASFATLEAEHIHNLAGKYRLFYGTPFDLDTLADIPKLDVNHISHVRIIDVIGSIEPVYASYDTHGNVINDPWPTAFPTSGFDLDAVGVIHQESAEVQHLKATVTPNPADTGSKIRLEIPEASVIHLSIINMQGATLYNRDKMIGQAGIHTFDMPAVSLSAGIYLLRVSSAHGTHTERFFFTE